MMLSNDAMINVKIMIRDVLSSDILVEAIKDTRNRDT
jgi:hypothetical protein